MDSFNPAKINRNYFGRLNYPVYICEVLIKSTPSWMHKTSIARYLSRTQVTLTFNCPLAETDRAVCFDASRADFGEHGVWFPKSQMIILDLGPDVGIIYFAKMWLYSKLR